MMVVAEYLAKDRILFDLDAVDYKQAMEQMLHVSEAETSEAIERIMEREATMSTVLGNGVALPRVILENKAKTEVIMAIIPKGAKFESLDLLPIKIIILHLFSKQDDHAAILAQTLRLMNDDNLKNEIINCRTGNDVIEVIREWEEDE
jgi:mannitol/fructose-specific phosphotransferase system IIA component (Ntr-type)